MPAEAPVPMVFCSPLRYVQGPDASARLADEMTSIGLSGPVLVVAGHTATEHLARQWAEVFHAVGWLHRVVAFGGEATFHEISTILDEAENLGAAVIVGAGGGKVLDAARAAAAQRRVPFVSCPTICSTDAPTSALSVIYDEAGVVEAIDIQPRSPELVLVDTRVIVESPPRFLAAGIGDALSTFYEARAVMRSGSPTMRGGRPTLAAFELSRLCRDIVLAEGHAALDACRRRTLEPALERVVEAATLLSGLGFESGGLAAAHAIHNGLTAIPATHDLLHGEKVAFGTLVQLALEAHLDEQDRRTEASAESMVVASFLHAIGLPVTLHQLGIADATNEAVATVARRATAAGETIHHMPFRVESEAVAAAILAADGIGRRVLAASANGS